MSFGDSGSLRRPLVKPSRLARAALVLYPPAWRARYGDEALACLEESGAGFRETVSLLWHVAPAWVWPAAHLHDRPARMRASLTTVLTSLAVLAALGLVFDQLTQQQGLAPAGHPAIGWLYVTFDAALALSVVILGAGCLPLWLLMMRRARRDRSPRTAAWLLTPFAAPAAYAAVLAAVLRATRHPDGVGQWEFLAITLAGLVTTGIAAAGPGIALRIQRPRGPALRLAATAAAIATAAAVTAAAASVVAATGLYLWAHHFVGYHNPALLGTYLLAITAVTAAAVTSSIRGIRATSGNL